MSVINIHERILDAPVVEVGELIDCLASPHDMLWPRDRWPAMKFDRPLSVGAKGGHGPIREFVEAYEPGRSIQFQFTNPKGFLGHHRFEVEKIEPNKVQLRHILEMRTVGLDRLIWPLVIRPLHDALLEDALDQAETHLGGHPVKREWSIWVKFLRWAMRQAKSVGMIYPKKGGQNE